MIKQYNVCLLCALVMTTILSSCGKQELKPYDQPFIHIMNNEASSATVNYQALDVKSYSIYLSSAPLTQNLEVTYQLTIGDGLKEGVDFERITKGNSLVFLPGIYDVPIRIRWLPSEHFDPDKDNTLTIELVSNNLGITMGLPGPDGLQKKFVITKVK